MYKAWRAKNAANLPTGVSLGWQGDKAYAMRVLQLNGGCVIVNKASGEVLAEVAGEAGRKTARLSPVMRAISEAARALRARGERVDGRNGSVGEDFRSHAVYLKADPSPATRAALAYCGADKIVEVRTGAEPVDPLGPAAQLLSMKLPIQGYLIPAQTAT